ncbi:hypothetical protein VTN77DRAFT_1431 [Rasamsonia byssochlamydoides]|uniref:uncharacterized protein n=1 Tax=Rasamsonia byssochlamydoides TaxID=89139 RepID=UPI00374261F9
MHEDAIRHYGFDGFCVGVGSCGLVILELESKEEKEVLDRMCAVTKDLVAKGADTLTLGRAGMTMLKPAVEEAVGKDVQVIDGVVAGVHHLVSMVRMGGKTATAGIYASSAKDRRARGRIITEAALCQIYTIGVAKVNLSGQPITSNRQVKSFDLMFLTLHSHSMICHYVQSSERLEQSVIDLTKRTDRIKEEEIATIFEQLEPIQREFLLGEWTGGGFDTGHSAHETLTQMKWAGKSFRSLDDVDPMIVYDEEGKRRWNETYGHARVREVRFRGVVSAAMIYDSFPIIDSFRAVKDDMVVATLLPTAHSKSCENITVPVDISARNGVFNVEQPQSNTDVTQFALNTTSIKWNFTEEALTGYQTVTGTYNISVKFCQPDNFDFKNGVIQVLTHGIGFDKTYWDLPFNNFNYSYIDVALDAGFCTLSLDRLGIGNSSIADPISIIQAPAEVSALFELNSMLRAGTLPGVPHTFGTIVNVGHSFGSVQTYQLAAYHPTATDGIVLTGWSANASYWDQIIASWNLQIARLNSPLRFGSITYEAVQEVLSLGGLWDLVAGVDLSSAGPPADLPNGYLTWGNTEANEYAFLYPGFYDPAILPYSEATKQPVTYGELLTILGSPSSVPDFTGPVLVVTGGEDKIFCGGSCLTTGDPDIASIPAAAAPSFPKASTFQAYIQPNTGHGINLHYNSTAAYKFIQNFLIEHGLGSS